MKKQNRGNTYEVTHVCVCVCVFERERVRAPFTCCRVRMSHFYLERKLFIMGRAPGMRMCVYVHVSEPFLLLADTDYILFGGFNIEIYTHVHMLCFHHLYCLHIHQLHNFIPKGLWMNTISLNLCGCDIPSLIPAVTAVISPPPLYLSLSPFPI